MSIESTAPLHSHELDFHSRVLSIAFAISHDRIAWRPLLPADPDLPKGWVAVPSRSHPGEVVYHNIHTGDRIAWKPGGDEDDDGAADEEEERRYEEQRKRGSRRQQREAEFATSFRRHGSMPSMSRRAQKTVAMPSGGKGRATLDFEDVGRRRNSVL